MPIEQTQGGTVATGQGVRMTQLLTSRKAIELELNTGLKMSSRICPTKAAIFALTGERVKATKKQKRRAIDLLTAEIERLRPIIAEENRLGRPLTEQEMILFEPDPED